MSVLVTGGAGFIGSHVVDSLIDAGRTVHILDDLSTGQKQFINPRAHFHKADIGSPDCDRIFRDIRPGSVIHLAAQIDVRKSVADPVADAQTNILGTLRVLENTVAIGARRFVFASTGGAIYGDTDNRPTPVGELCQPVSPYGITKLSIEKYLHYYQVHHSLSALVMRFGNVYGQRQNPHGEAGVVAIFCQRMLRGEPTTINGDGLQSRDYVHVSDVAQAVCLAEKSSIAKGIFNVGTAIEKNVVELFEILRDELDPDRRAQHGPEAPGEQRTSCLDWSRTRDALGWQPRVDFEQGLRETARWFRAEQAKAQ